MDPVELTIVASWVLFLLAVCGAVVYGAYQSYTARRIRESRPPGDAVDYVREMSRINAQLSKSATESREALEKARDTVRRGIKG